MKFKTDENFPAEAAAALRNSGFEAETIQDEALLWIVEEDRIRFRHSG
jgi:hypothetical protein